jgi:hypothetical protein
MAGPTRDQTALLRDFGWNTRREIVGVNRNGVLRLQLQLAPWAIALLREIE